MILAICLLSMHVAAPADVTIELRESVEARGVELVIADVAEVTGTDADHVRRVRELSLGFTPAPGYTRVISRGDVARALTSAKEIEAEITGRNSARVKLVTRLVEAKEAEAALRKGLSEVFAGLDAEIALVGSVTDVTIPEPRETLELVVTKAGVRIDSGQQGVALDIVIDGSSWRTIWSTWQFEVFEELYVLKSPGSIGSTLDASMFEMRRVKRTKTGPGSTPLPEHLFAHSVLNRDIPAGVVVTEADVNRIFAVRKGDTVKIEVRNGSVSAFARGTAVSSGSVGERIPVRLETNQRELIGVIESAGMIVIDLSTKVN